MRNLSKTQWLDVLLNPFSLAIPLAITVILLLPDFFEKYKIELVKSEAANKANSVEEYIDLDADGYSERLVFFINEVGAPAMKVLTNSGLTLDQWNFPGRYPPRSKYFYCGDADRDGRQEIYLFTMRSDSVLLHGIAPFSKSGCFLQDRFITTISRHRDTIHGYVEHGQFCDLDKNGNVELVFNVEAGFSMQPRAFFVYCPENDSLFQSQSIGVNFGKTIINDSDRDGEMEIFCSCNTLGNIHDSMNIPYNDYSSYILGFDHQLNLLFPPLKYEVYPSSAIITSVEFSGKSYYAYYFRNLSSHDTVSEIGLLNAKGIIVKRRSVRQDDVALADQNLLITLKGADGKEFLAMLGSDQVVFLDEELKVNGKVTISGAEALILKSDLNLDGEVEWVFKSSYSNVLVTQKDFKNPMMIDAQYDSFSKSPLCISVKKNGDEYPELFIKSANKAYFYSYTRNILYYFKYPVWIGIYLALVLLTALIQYLQKARMERRMKLEDTLNALLLKNIKNQVDPHFTFNAINTISAMAIKGGKEKLARFSSDYAGLMRRMLNQSDKIQSALQDELEFNILYLELQQTRYNEAFDFSIEVDEDVDREMMLPRTLLHTYVENAVKHGVNYLEKGGMIAIRVLKDRKSVVIEVEDNGPGRKRSARYGSKDGTGKGLEIVGNILELYKKLYAIEITTEISDIYTHDGQVAGMRVRIVIPD